MFIILKLFANFFQVKSNSVRSVHGMHSRRIIMNRESKMRYICILTFDLNLHYTIILYLKYIFFILY